MKFINPACFINNLRRSHSKKAYALVHEDLDDQTQKLIHQDHQDKTQRTSEKKKQKQGSSHLKGSPKTFDVYVGVREEEKYRVPMKYFGHPKLRELINKYRPFVLDPRASDPIAVECSTEIFEQVLRSIVKNR